MRLQKINIDRIPGIRTPFTVEAKKGVNLILGPNESGKSSLVRTMLHLLWPAPVNGSPIIANGEFIQDGKRLQAESNHDSLVTWNRDGQKIDRPNLPDSHTAFCYKLGVLDLMRPQANGNDERLASEIRRRMAGGYDLEALGLIIPDPVNEFNRAQKAWIQKKQHFGKVLLAQKNLSQDQYRLEELDREAKGAEQARDRTNLLQMAMRLQNNAQEIAGFENQLDAYPPGMKNLRPDDATTLAGYRSRLTDFQQQCKEQQEALDQRSAELASLDLPPESDQINTDLVAEFLQEGNLLRETKLELERAVAGAALRCAQEEKKCDPRVLEPGTWQQASPQELFHKLSRLHSETMGAEAALREHTNLVDEKPFQDLVIGGRKELQELQKAAKAINEKMAGIVQNGGFAGPPNGNLLWGSVAIIAGVFGCLTSVINPASIGKESLLIGSAILSCLAGGVLVFKWWQKRRQQSSNRMELQLVCMEHGQPLPAGWTENQSRNFLFEMGNRITRTETVLEAMDLLQQKRAAAVQGCENDLNKLEEKRQVILQQHGLPTGLNRDDLLAGLGTLDRLLSARSEWEKHQGKLQECTRQIEEAENHASQEFAAGGIVSPKKLEALAASLAQLEKKRQTRDVLLQAQRQGQGQLATVESNQKHQEQEIQKLLQRLELSDHPDPDYSVSKLVEEQDQYLGIQKTLNSLRTDSQRLQTELEDGSALLGTEEWKGKTIAELAKMMGLENEKAAGADALRDEVAAINARINAARNSSEFEDAKAALDQSEDHLSSLFDKRNTAALAQILLQETESSFEQNSRPKILEEASRLFGLFTRNRYQLRVTSGPGKNSQQVFQAVSNDDATRYLDIEELSDGTRAQLFLAARLAFIQEIETGAQPPLFLDESLTSSDPVRFAAIAGSLAQWADESSRQIFYLTSNPADVAAWTQVMKDTGFSGPFFIDLGSIRTASKAADPASFSPPSTRSVPEPGTLTAAEYGLQLRIPKLEPWAGEDAAPLYYLLEDDLSLLHKLLLAGASTLGQWRSLDGQMVQAGIMTRAQKFQLETRGQVLGAFIDAWLQGRGKPLDAHSLKESNILSSKMLPQAIILLDNERGNAQGFMDAIHSGQVKRLHTSKKTELQNYLELHGFIDSRPLLDPDQIMRHVIRAVASELSGGTISLDELHYLVAQLDQAISKN